MRAAMPSAASSNASNRPAGSSSASIGGASSSSSDNGGGGGPGGSTTYHSATARTTYHDATGMTSFYSAASNKTFHTAPAVPASAVADPERRAVRRRRGLRRGAFRTRSGGAGGAGGGGRSSGSRAGRGGRRHRQTAGEQAEAKGRPRTSAHVQRGPATPSTRAGMRRTRPSRSAAGTGRRGGASGSRTIT